MRPVECFDVRGYVGFLTAYVSDPELPALLVQKVDDITRPEPFPLSVNLVEHGWRADGLEIAVKDYEPWYARVALMLVAHDVLVPTGKIVEGPFDSRWTVYKLVEDKLKPEAIEAWKAWLAEIRGGDRPEGMDLSPENLKRLAQAYIARYEKRLTWPNAIPGELRSLIALWREVEKKGGDWDQISRQARQEVVEAIEDEE